MRLNVGSHSKRIDGFDNVDILNVEGVDILCDITRTPWVFQDIRQAGKQPVTVLDDSVEEIIMIEVLEHIEWQKCGRVLAEIYRVLKPGGKLHIQVPDCGAMMEMYVNGEVGEGMPHKIGEADALKLIKQMEDFDKDSVQRVHPMRWLMAFCGAQKYGVPDIHKNIFTKEKLAEELENAGFDQIDFKDDPLRWKIKVNVTK